MPTELSSAHAPEVAGTGGGGRVLGKRFPNPNLILEQPRCQKLPLQEGEVVVAGQVRSPAMWDVELQVALRWHAQVYSKPRPKGWAPWQLLLQPGGSDDLAQDPLCHSYLSNIADLLGLKDITDKDLEGWFGKPRQAGNKKQRVAAGREVVLGRLPKDPPCCGVEPFEVPGDDPRQPLRGKEGIRAGAEGVKAGDIIGPYRSYCLLEEDYQMLLASPPDWLVARYQGDQAVALCNWQLWLESYAAEEAHEEVDGCMAKFIFSGFGYGNESCLANDPHIQPPTNRAEEEDPQRSAMVPWLDGQQHGTNAQLYVFCLMGWPYAFMVATQNIPPGQEVLYKYGTGYWQTVMPHWTHYNAADRACQTARKLQQLQEKYQSLLEQHESLQQQLAAVKPVAATASQCMGATFVQQASMLRGGRMAGPAVPVVDAATASNGIGGSGRASPHLDHQFSGLQQHMKQRQAASSSRKGDAEPPVITSNANKVTPASAAAAARSDTDKGGNDHFEIACRRMPLEAPAAGAADHTQHQQPGAGRRPPADAEQRLPSSKHWRVQQHHRHCSSQVATAAAAAEAAQPGVAPVQATSMPTEQVLGKLDEWVRARRLLHWRFPSRQPLPRARLPAANKVAGREQGDK